MLRPPLPHHASTSSSTSSTGATPTPARQYDGTGLAPLLAEITVFIVPAKLDVGALLAKIDALGGTRVARPEDARIVVTALKGRPRLVRVLGAQVTKMGNLVSEQYIDDAYARTLAAERSGKVPSLPPRDEYRIRLTERSPSIEILDGPGTPSKESKRGIEDYEAPVAKRRRLEAEEAKTLPDITLYPADMRLRDIPRMACERPCPLTCVNQDIIDAIKPIYLAREYDELDQKNSNVLSYRRSMSILKSVPKRIKSGTEARKLFDVGEKVAERIDEFLITGQVAESEAIRASPRYQALKEFASVYSIGQATAAELWDRRGCRTLRDLRVFYCGLEEEDELEEGREGRQRRKRRLEGNMTRAETVAAWLDRKAELDEPIPRSEVEAIAAIAHENLEALCPGTEQTICGGFRRGKTDSNDVDVIFRPPGNDSGAGLLRALYRRLAHLGIITHVLHVSERDPNMPLHSHGANFDNLDKAFVIFKLPGKGAKHRRVDLICAPPERYAAAVLSWSGSMMFERDFRRFVEDRGLKFRAGLIDRNTNTEINLPTERDIFAYVGLAYIPPELRNADG